jgi:pimeloyl-ACP methyl ester carboxylesterase
MALIFNLLLLADILLLFLIGLDAYLFREWYLDRTDSGFVTLTAAILLLVFLIRGKSLLLSILGKKAEPGDEFHMERSTDYEKLKRPDGSVIHIEHAGSFGKQAILFVHGWNSNAMQWYYQKRYFAEDYHLILIDLPGVGRSKKADNNDFSIEKFAADLDAVLDHTKPKDPFLWGHSIGGMCILTFCRHFISNHSQVKGLILQHTTYTNPLKTIIFSGLLSRLQNIVLKPLCWLMIISSPIVWLFRWISYSSGILMLHIRVILFGGSQTRRQLEVAALLWATARPASTARGILGMFNYDATDVLSEIKIPVLIFAARHDRLTRPVAGSFMKERIPNSRLFLLDSSGHLGLMEQHREVNEAAGSFLHDLK